MGNGSPGHEHLSCLGHYPCRGNTFMGRTQSRREIPTAEAFWMDGADPVPFPPARKPLQMNNSFHCHSSTVAQSYTDITLLYCERLLPAHIWWDFALYRRRCLGFGKEGWLTNKKSQDPLSSPERLSQGGPFSETPPGIFERDQW